MRSGLKFKTALIISLIVVIGLSAISTIGYIFSKKSIVEINDNLISSIAKSEANDVQNFLDDTVTKVEGISLLEGLQNVNPEEAVPTLKRAYDFYKDTFVNVSFANAEGTRWNYKGEKDTIADRDYFKQAMVTKKSVISDVLISGTTGEISIVVAAPILDSQKVAKGLVYATLSLKKLQQVTEELKHGKSGFGFIFDDKGIVVSHGTNAEIVGKLDLNKAEDKEPLKKIWNQKEQVAGKNSFKYDNSGVKQVSVLEPISVAGGDPWYFGFSMSEKEVLQSAVSLGNTLLIVSILFIIAAIIIAIFYSSSIVSPIISLSEVAKFVADGDLSKEVKTLRTQDELGELSQSISIMTKNLRELVGSVKAKSELVAASSQELSASAEEFFASAQSVADTVMRVQDEAVEQRCAVDKSGSEAEEGLAVITNLSSSTKEIVNTVEETAKIANEGQSSLQGAVNQMEQILTISTQLQALITKLGQKSNEIGSITGSITGIATQTNLLALNAAIEAARAGEAGRGFTVVADEVRKLAEQAQDSAALISQLVNETQQDTLSAVNEMNSFLLQINGGASIVKEAGETFRNISTQTTEAAKGMADMFSLIKNVGEGSKNIIEAINRIGTVSDNTSKDIREISQSVEDQTAATEEIAASTQSLSRLADELNILISKFKI